ncbi:hypothetical protein ACEPAF_3743 [Sanghuangporus sanghuang]
MFELSLPHPFATNVESKLDGASGSPDDLTHDTLELLRHFEGHNYTLPPSARVDPTVRQRQRERLGFLDLWKYIAFVIGKSMDSTHHMNMEKTLIHCLWGPKRKSWGWEMTFVTSVMQNASDHTHLADLPTLRRLINISGYTPLPSDAMVTPVTFPVRKRNLRGILSELDRAEDGTRELSGEWVVGRKLWKQLQAEWKASKVSSGGKTSSPDAPKRKDRVILYLHGGAYYMFSAATHRQLTIQLAKYTESRLFAVDYRLAPEVRFPGQIHDAVSAYLRLLELKIPPENILVAGDSAGGALSLVLLFYLRDNGYPLPSGAVLMSPWVDLTMSCDSWDINVAYDIIPPPKPGDHLNPIHCYLGEDTEKLIAHPYASPLFGDFHGLPPLLLQAGDSEVLRDEITLLAHKARLAGVQVRHELYEDGVHVFQQFLFLGISRRAFQACREFVMQDLPDLQERSPQYLDRTTQNQLKAETANDSTQEVNGEGSTQVQGRLSPAEISGNGDFRALYNGDAYLNKPTVDCLHESAKEKELEHDEKSKAKHKWSTLRRFGLTPFKEKDGAASKQRDPSPTRNHHRRATGEHPSHFLSTPAPSIRSRSRTASHQDISSLCQQWADSKPSERPTTYVPASGPNHTK